MTDTTTSRRQMLKTLSAAGGLTVLGVSEASAAVGQQVRVIESGIRYDVPDGPQYDGHHVDSRPPYTVDREAGKLLLTPRASAALQQDLSADGSLVAERTPAGGEGVSVGRSGKRDSSLPTALSARMRITNAISLASPHTHSSVSVHWNANGAAVTVQSQGRTDVAAGSSEEIALDPVTVEARTVAFTERTSIPDGVPAEAVSPERTYDSVAVEATPVVEVVDHGELTVDRIDPPEVAPADQ